MEPRTLGDGRYELIEEIGRGGMASVWRARDTRLNVDRAIKLLDRPSTRRRTAASRARFDREARIMARLEHPHVVPVHDAGEDDGQLWIVMSLVDGGSVGARLARDGPMDAREAVGVAMAVLDALAAAHAAGIVHRDVKPHNVLLDARGVPRLGDFGIASAEGEGGPTQTGAVLGTWTYMAPEQRVDAKRADARTDLYAVGVLLVAMVLGRDPSDLHDPARTDTVVNALPPPLRAFVRRCTRYQPDERFASAEEALAALRAIADRLDLPDADGRPRRWWPVGAALGLGGAALAGLGVGGVATLGALGLAWSRFGRVAVPPEAPDDPGLAEVVDTAADLAPPPLVPSPSPSPAAAPRESPPAAPAAAPEPDRPPEPDPAPPPVPTTRVRLAVNGEATDFEVHRGGERLVSAKTMWNGELPVGELQLRMLRGGQVVHRRTWNTATTPQLCLDAEDWEPCRR